MITARKLNNRGGTDNLEKRGPYKQDIYQRFVSFSVLIPKEKKQQYGVATQKEFAEKYGISPVTLSEWKSTKVFKDNRREAKLEILDEQDPEVWASFMKRLKKYGFAYEMEVYLAYVEGWDRKQVIEFANELQLNKGDIRALVDKLPVDKRNKFYDTLVDLIDEAKRAGVDA